MKKEKYINIEGLSKSFPKSNNSKEKLEVLHQINLSVDSQEFLTFFGPNGCGKTTFLKILAGLENFESGIVKIGNRDPKNAKISFIFQNYKESLFPWRNVHDNIAFPLEIQGINRNERTLKVKHFIDEIGIDIDLKAFPYQLSGGQQQLVAILRALIYYPDVILMDEPFSSLDFQNTFFIRDIILDVWKKTRTTILFISHDIEEAIYLADRMVFFSKRPARIKKILDININRPRSVDLLNQPKFLKYKSEALELFKQEI